MKIKLIISSLCATFMIASVTNAMAHDRIAKHLDRKGDRIETRLDKKAAKLDARGKHCKAAKLRLKGDRINAKLNHKAKRVRQRS